MSLRLRHQVHVFPEGKVNQSHIEWDEHNVAHLPRFKWGMYVRPVIIRPVSLPLTLPSLLPSGRILMETDTPPTLIPMWLSGMFLPHLP
jgi:hypothetical protein